MSLQLQIPDAIIHAIRFPEDQITEKLKKDLAISLYAQGLLTFGKARGLAGMHKYDFGQILGENQIPRHYGQEELDEDLAYARGQ